MPLPGSALHGTLHPSLGVCWDALLVFWITNPKAKWLSGDRSVYVWACFYSCLSPSLRHCRLCSSVRQVQPSFNETQTALCKCVFVNVESNAWMDDKQCEIMTGSEYKFHLRVPDEGKNMFMYICVPLVCFKKGNVLKWTQMLDWRHMWLLSRCVCPTAL